MTPQRWHADVSITLGGATDLALESADIVLTNSDGRFA